MEVTHKKMILDKAECGAALPLEIKENKTEEERDRDSLSCTTGKSPLTLSPGKQVHLGD